MLESSIGPYRILEKLGSGGMGDVYLAEDTRLKRKVALKSLSESAPGARERLLREARAAATLNHPNIAAIYDIVESSDRTHIVMEYVEGESLSRRLSRGRLPAEDTTAIALQLCDAMAAAHAQGVVHRDLKPGNVSLTRDGKVKVLDFGLATTPPGLAEARGVSSLDTTPSEGKRLLGTPAYMAPEQLRRQPVDERTDVYGVGVMLYELLTGRRPFGGEGVVELGMAILNEPTPTAAQAEPTVPAGLSAIVARAMSREPAERFQSAVEMRSALRRLPPPLTDAPTLSAAFPWDPRTARTLAGVRARPVVATLGVAGAVILGLVAYKGLRQPPSEPVRSAHKPPVVAVLPLANLGGSPEDDYIGVGVADTLITHLAGLSALTVVSRSATQEYQGRLSDTRGLARELGLTYVVSGTVQRVDRRLRVTLNLVRPDDSVAWGQDYEGTLDDVFGLQRRVAEGLSAGLQLSLTPRDRQRLERSPTRDVDAFADYARARGLLERPDVPGNVATAIQRFQSAIDRDPRFALAHAGLGEASWAMYQETKDALWTKLALDAATEALRLDPEQPATRLALAVVYHGTGRTAAAIDELQRVLALQPASDEAHRLLGGMLADQGRFDEAGAELQKAIARRPDYWRHHNYLGSILFEAGRFAEAIPAFRRVTELQPDNARGYLNLGTVYLAMENDEAALQNLLRANEIAPDAFTWSNIGTLRYWQGRYGLAGEAYREAIRLSPNEPRLHRNLGDACQQLGRTQDARRAYQKALELTQGLLRVNPNDAAGIAELAVYEAKLGKARAAVQHAVDAASRSPNDGEVLYRQAVVQALAGDPRNALDSLKMAISHGYSRRVASRDHDLALLRTLPEFAETVGAAR